MKKLADIVTGKASRKKLSNSEIILEPKIKQDLNDDKKTKLNEGQMIDKDYGIIHDPVKAQLNNIISHSNYHEARAIEHPKHGVFAWASEKATHDDVIKHLHKDLGYDMGKDEPTHLFVSSHKKTGELMLNKFKNPNPFKDSQEIEREGSLIKGIKHSSVQDYNTNSIHESVLFEGKMLDREDGLVHEPTTSQLRGIITNSKFSEARALHDEKHGLFAWNSAKDTHDGKIADLNRNHGFEIDPKKAQHLTVTTHRDTNELFYHNQSDGSVNHPTINKLRKAKDEYDYDEHQGYEPKKATSESYSENQTEKMFCKLEELAEENELDPSVLFQVFIRGVETWNKNMKITSEQYAFNRVHSFLNGGNAFYLDEDLLSEEEIAEISKNLANRYIKKSAKDILNQTNAFNHFEEKRAKSVEAAKGQHSIQKEFRRAEIAHYEAKSTDHDARATRRIAGVRKAADKLAGNARVNATESNEYLKEAFIRKMQIRTGILSGAAREVFGDSLAARAVYNAEHKIGHAIHHHLHKKEYAKQAAEKEAHIVKKKAERDAERQKRRSENIHDAVQKKYHGAKATVAGRADGKAEAKAKAAAAKATPTAAAKPAPKPLKSIISHAKRTPKPSNNN